MEIHDICKFTHCDRKYIMVQRQLRLDIMELYPILWLIVAAISVVPMYVFWKGYFRLGSKKIRLTAIAFTLFFFKALSIGSELFLNDSNEGTWFLNDEFWLCVAAILDMMIISLIVITFGSTNGEDEETTGSADEKAVRNKGFLLPVEGEAFDKDHNGSEEQETSTSGEPTNPISRD